MFSKIKYEYLLLLIALAWALFFAFVLQLTPGFSVVGDDGSYLFAAKEMYLHQRLNDARPLLIAAINGFPFLFGFGDPQAIVWSNAVNLLCWWFTSLLLFRILTHYCIRKMAFIAALVFVFCIGNLANAFNMLSEPVFIFVLLLAFYFMVIYEKSNQGKYATLALSFLVLAILIKPLAIGITAIVALSYIGKYKSILTNRFAIVLVFSLGLVGFQLIQIKKQYGDYTISYISSITYYNYLGAKADCLKKNIPFVPGENERAHYFSQFSSHEQKKIATADFKDQLQHNPLNLGKAYAFCLYSNSSKASYIVSEAKNTRQTAYFDFFYFALKALSKLQTLVFTFAGALLSFLVFFRKTSGFYKIIALGILYIFFISAMSCLQCDRFHIVFFPMVIILAADYLTRHSIKM